MSAGEIMVLPESTRIWVCEKAHVDDHHSSALGDERCSRCGGSTSLYSLAELVARFSRRQGAVRTWIVTADAELQPIVEGAGVDILEHIKAAQGALGDALTALFSNPDSPEENANG